jgi:transcription initiation factor TFIID TATA-box-binding protein
MRKRTYSSLSSTYTNNIKLDIDHSYSGTHEFPIAVIHNLVGTTELYCSSGNVDLDLIASVLPNSFYDRQRFAAITIRIADPMCTALLFTSGKLVLTGSRSWCQCLLASIHIARLLTAHCRGVVFHVRDTSVQNIVGNAVIPLEKGECLDLQAMYDALGTMCTWQPNMFPGLVLRPDNSPVVLLCFYSGKVVVTGGKMETDIYDGWANLWPTVRRFIRLRADTHNQREEKSRTPPATTAQVEPQNTAIEQVEASIADQNDDHTGEGQELQCLIETRYIQQIAITDDMPALVHLDLSKSVKVCPEESKPATTCHGATGPATVCHGVTNHEMDDMVGVHDAEQCKHTNDMTSSHSCKKRRHTKSVAQLTQHEQDCQPRPASVATVLQVPKIS